MKYTLSDTFQEKLRRAYADINSEKNRYPAKRAMFDFTAPWASERDISEALNHCKEAQGALANAGFTSNERPLLELEISSLKCRAESISATSDGYVAIAAVISAWTVFILAMSRLVGEPLGLLLGGLGTSILFGTSIFFIANRLGSRRHVDSLKELATHLELFLKHDLIPGAAATATANVTAPAPALAPDAPSAEPAAAGESGSTAGGIGTANPATPLLSDEITVRTDESSDEPGKQAARHERGGSGG